MIEISLAQLNMAFRTDILESCWLEDLASVMLRHSLVRDWVRYESASSDMKVTVSVVTRDMI